MQAGQTTQQQKVTYATTTQLQQAIKPQFFTTTSIAQPQKTTTTQQIQVGLLWHETNTVFISVQWVCLQVWDFLVYCSFQAAKLPQMVQPAVANIQQIVSSPQQVRALLRNL